MHDIIYNLSAIFEALGPIFSIIVLGHVLRRSGFPGEAFWPAAERLTYFLLFPSLLVHRLALANLGDYAVLPIAGIIVTVLMVMSAVVFLLKPVLRVDGAAFSSIYQGSIRFNTYVGLAAAVALFGSPGAMVAALAIAILIPLVNLLCVGVMTHSIGAGNSKTVIRALCANPLILACLLGIFLNASGLGLPLGSGAVLEILSRAALPLGLLAVGAALRLHVALTRPKELISTAILKLLLQPLLTFSLCWGIGLSDLETVILVLFAALPGAPSAYILARQLGGDAELMAAIVTIETAISIVTLPAVLVLVS